MMKRVHTRKAPTFDLKHLHLLETLATMGSMTQAARHLHVTQSAISHQLKEIELRAGGPLFTRATPLVATARAQMLLERARPLLAEVAKFELALAAPAIERRVRLSTGCYTSYHWLPEVVTQFARTHAGVQLELALDETRRPIEGLLRGRLELAVSTDEPRHKRALLSTTLFDDELWALVRPDSVLATRRHLTPNDFEHEHVLVHDAPLDSLDVWTRFLRPAKVRPSKLSHVPLTEAMVELARAGTGVAVLASWVARPFIQRGGLVAVRLGAKGLRRSWFAVRRRDDPLSELLDDLTRAIAATGPTV